jgi:hypothetical protein
MHSSQTLHRESAAIRLPAKYSRPDVNVLRPLGIERRTLERRQHRKTYPPAPHKSPLVKSPTVSEHPMD